MRGGTNAIESRKAARISVVFFNLLFVVSLAISTGACVKDYADLLRSARSFHNLKSDTVTLTLNSVDKIVQ
ncbi:unnamed protein product, partial [Iphiclides podalirius]